jgi:hypothetical protein
MFSKKAATPTSNSANNTRDRIAVSNTHHPAFENVSPDGGPEEHEK